MTWLPRDIADKVLTPEQLTRWRENPTAVPEDEHEESCFDSFVYIHEDGTSATCPVCSTTQATTNLADTLQKSGIGARYIQTDWEDLEPVPPIPRLLKAAKRIREIRNAGHNLIMWGDPGTGKTQAAALIVKSAIQTGLTARIENLGRLGMMIREGYQTQETHEHQIVTRLAHTDILILDDVGANETGGAKIEQRIMYGILEDRQNNRRPTIITTNLPPAELAHTLGQRLINRIQPLTIIHFDHGRNFRKPSPDEKNLW